MSLSEQGHVTKVATPPRFEGRFFKLVPVLPNHVPFLYGLAVGEQTGYRWRFRGTVPSPQAFEANLWQGVECQFIVVEKSSDQPVGLVVAYGAELHDGHMHVGMVLNPQAQKSRLGFEGLLIFLRYLFTVYKLRKVYFEMPEYNIDQFGSGRRYAVEEGRFKNHDYYGGCYWDRVFRAFYAKDVDSIPDLTGEFRNQRSVNSLE